MGRRDGRAGDALLGRASTAVGAWTRAVRSARLDRVRQVDGVSARGSPASGRGRLTHPYPRSVTVDELDAGRLEGCLKGPDRILSAPAPFSGYDAGRCIHQ